MQQKESVCMKKFRYVDIYTNVHRWYGVKVRTNDDFTPVNIRYMHINECYKNCSNIKREIFDECELLAISIRDLLFDLLGDNCIMHTGVCSYNAMMFTFGANFYSAKGQLIAALYITKTRTELTINPSVSNGFFESVGVYE